MQGVGVKDENERTIVTYNPEEAIWYYISKLTHLEYVIDQLKVRISKQFFGFPLEKISQNKESYMKKLSDNGYSEIYTPITDDDLVIRSNAEAIIHTTKQAIEFYRASKVVSIYAKPILLYYCYMRLAKILFLATYRQEFKKAKKSKAHGLSMNSTAGEITIQPAGFFPRFQDSFYPDPSIYLDSAVIGWEDLLNPATQGFYLFDNIRANKLPDYHKNILKEHGLFGGNKVEVRVRHSKYNNLSSKYMIHELTRELLFV
jgi:hypothetical protein